MADLSEDLFVARKLRETLLTPAKGRKVSPIFQIGLGAIGLLFAADTFAKASSSMGEDASTPTSPPPPETPAVEPKPSASSASPERVTTKPASPAVIAKAATPTAPTPISAPSTSTPVAAGFAGLAAPSKDAMDYIDEASQVAGVDKALLLAIAQQESSFNVNAKAKTTSAQGLFQVVDATRKAVLAKYRKVIDGLVTDGNVARVNALVGAFYIRDLIANLKSSLGREPAATDIYAGHFLGASGARRLLNAIKSNPDTAAADLMPKAAKSNPAIFYDKSGQPRTVAQVYGVLYQKVGSQYTKYAAAIGQQPTMAAAGFDVTMPDFSQTQVASTTFPTTVKSSTTVAAATDFKLPPKSTVDTTVEKTSPTTGPAQVAAVVPVTPDSLQEYRRDRRGRVIAMTG
jgi:hypothetical protein